MTVKGPTHEQIKAVRNVLYNPSRERELSDHVQSIITLMNFNPLQAIPETDTRYPAGSGPSWFLLSTGAVDGGVLEAAGRCAKIATLLLQIRSELQHLNFPNTDKKHIRAALQAQAAWWTIRANWWKAPNAVTDPQAIVDQLATQLRVARDESSHVKQYYVKAKPQ